MIIRLILIAFLFAGGGAHIAAAQSQESYNTYVSGLPTIPLMPGLTEIESESVLFDKAEGQIAIAEAEGRGLTRADIVNYYRSALPELGWSEAKSLGFTRNEEALILHIAPLNKDEPEGVRVTFNLQPK